MESISDELYYGKINGSEIKPSRTEEYKQACREATQAIGDLTATLSPKQRELFDRAVSKITAENEVLLRQMYGEGMFFGVRLLSETYSNALHRTSDRLWEEGKLRSWENQPEGGEDDGTLPPAGV